MNKIAKKTSVTVAIFILSLLTTKNTICQVKAVNVKKVIVSGVTSPPGEKLVVELNIGDSMIVTPDQDYYLHKIRPLSDSVKLAVIGKLLQYKNDTSLCALRVYKYNYNGYETVCARKPKSFRFPIQVDALYMINIIVAQEKASFCSCFPVVVNTQTGEEINMNPKLIEEYYSIYEK